MSVSYWLDQNKGKKEIRTDIAIIGGGITGISLAYWLDKLGGAKVTLIERGRMASGATGRNAGFLISGMAENHFRMWNRHGPETAKLLHSLTAENHRLIEDELIKKKQIDCGFSRRGSVTSAITDEEFIELEKSYNLLLKDGFECKLLRTEINEKLKTEGLRGGILNPADGSLNPVRLVAGIADTLSDDIAIIDRCEVFDISNDSGDILIRSERMNVRCDMAVAAVNAYAPTIIPKLKGEVSPTRGQLLATAPIEEKLFDGHAVYCDFGYEYFRQLDDGTLLMGGFRQHYRADELGYSDETTDNIQKGLERFIAGHIPAASGKKITHRWSGVMGFTTDGLPIVGEIPSTPGLMFIGGYTGHGLAFAFILAKALAEQLINGKTQYPLDLFSIRRLLV
ncbi:MAG: FAD-dependent oxidoreductase [candidate division Zixibacteria bacterium]|nr:FAD-dependent oxidoreductase [candidate division Zixibacteria bacterium]